MISIAFMQALPAMPESASKGEFIFNPLRTIVVINAGPPEAMTAPLQAWAARSGYKFRVTPITGEAGSLLFEVWNDDFALSGDPRFEKPGFEFDIYLNSDHVDQAFLTNLADHLRDVLAPFGPVTVSAAPPDTPPRLDPKTNRPPRP